jgi:hypothetical protein
MTIAATAPFPEVTSLAEQAVQKIAEGSVISFGRERSKGIGSQGRSKRCRNITVDRDVWAAVIAVASCPACVEIISETEVIVWNSVEQAAAMRSRRSKVA